MSKIFVRERRKIQEGEKKPRFRVVGVSGGGIKLYVKHMRRNELRQVASDTGAEIVYLPVHDSGKKDGTGQ